MNLFSYYINLDKEVERRSLLEDSYLRFIGRNWPLSRIAAIESNSELIKNTTGALTASEKACFESHKLALKESAKTLGHAYILEDDAMFGSFSFNVINECLNQLEGQEWDILYTDISVPHPASMIEFFLLKTQLAKESKWRLLNLDAVGFAGATAYIVNSSSKEKLLSVLTSAKQLNVPYDLLLRNLIHQKSLRAFVIFPFASTLSKIADQSQIQPTRSQATELAWNAFRRLVWLNCKEEPLNLLGLINTMDLCPHDERSNAMGSIISVVTSTHFVNK